MKKQKVQIIKDKKTERICSDVYDILELVRVMEGHGEKLLFSYRKNGKDFDMTYAAFLRDVKRVAAGLHAVGLAGKHIAVIGETRPEWHMIYFATLLTGGVIIPMDKELSPIEIGNFLTLAKAEAIAYPASIGKVLETEGHETLRVRIPFDEICETDTASGQTILPIGDLMEKGAEDFEYTPFTDEDRERMCEMLFTSGTTGTSKCVMLCQKNVFAAVRAAVHNVPFFPDDVVLSVLPVHHTYELMCNLAEMDYGMHICINDSLRRVLVNIQKYKPTGLVLVPLFVETMYKKILAEAKKSGKENTMKLGVKLSRAALKVNIDLRAKLFKSVRDAFGGRVERIICGGAALNPNLVRAFEDFGMHIYEGYGITECSPLIAVSPYYARKYGSVGPALPCCKARIAGDKIGEHGYVEGEIQVIGDNVMLGYYGNSEANAEAFTEDGWYRTGDVGYMDDDGYIFITGRIKSVIVLENGKNVFPEEIEEYLGRIEEIAESVVVGRKAENSDAVVLTAIVFPNASAYAEGTDRAAIEEDIRKKVLAMNRKLPSFKQIHKVEFRDVEFEKTTSRKIRRHLVK